MNKYIFISSDDNFDYNHIEMIGTDFEKVFNCARKSKSDFIVWVDNSEEEIFSSYVGESLDYMIECFKKCCIGSYDDLLEMALPILEKIQEEYVTENEKLIKLKEQEKIDKELLQLAKLKAKYEK